MVGSIIASTFLYWISIGSSIEGPYVSYLETAIHNCSNSTTDISSDPYVKLILLANSNTNLYSIYVTPQRTGGKFQADLQL